MSHDTLEQAVLSGAMFRDPSSLVSEFREEDRQTPSPEPNTDDELGSDYSPPSSPRRQAGAPEGGASRSTGVKGVIKDQKAAAFRAREQQLARRLLANEALEERALLAPTWEEDDELRAGEQTEAGERTRRWAKTPGGGLANGNSGGGGGGERHRPGGERGFLREVSSEGFLNAVDQAAGWVVVLVFEPVRPAAFPLSLVDSTVCRLAAAEALLLSAMPVPLSSAPQEIKNLTSDVLLSLQSLAASHPPPGNAFLLARASTLGLFLRPQDGLPDFDLLPSLLVYAPGGELRRSFIRLDLELQGVEGGVEGLLRRSVLSDSSPVAEPAFASAAGHPVFSPSLCCDH